MSPDGQLRLGWKFQNPWEELQASYKSQFQICWFQVFHFVVQKILATSCLSCIFVQCFGASLRAKRVPRRNHPAKHCSAKCAGICESLREGMKIPAAKAIKQTIHKLKNRGAGHPNLDGLQMIFDWTQQTYARQFQISSLFLKIQPNGLQLWPWNLSGVVALP